MEENNQRNLSLEMWAEANRQHDLYRLHFFLKLKHLNKKTVTCTKRLKNGDQYFRETDPSGGFLHVSKLKETAAKLGVSHNTLRQRLSDFKKKGWVTRTHTGWGLISWRKVIEPYCPDLKKIKYFAPTAKELKQIMAYQILTRSQVQQAYNRYGRTSKKWLSKNVHGIIAKSLDAEFSMSCRTLTKRMGFKSAITGCRYEHRLKRAKLIKIQNRCERICHVSDYGLYLKCNPELWKYCFVYGEFVYQRLCNHILPISKAA